MRKIRKGSWDSEVAQRPEVTRKAKLEWRKGWTGTAEHLAIHLKMDNTKKMQESPEQDAIRHGFATRITLLPTC